MAQQQGGSSAEGGRLDGSLQHTTLAIGDFAFGAGWGDGTIVTTLTAGSTDQRGTVSVQSVGANQAQATATIVLTFADGAYASTPFVYAQSTNDNSIDTGRFKVTSVSTTAVTFTHSLTPVDTKTYILKYLVIA